MVNTGTPKLHKAGGWVIVWGVLLIITGIIAIVAPGAAALATALLLAWVFVFGGAIPRPGWGWILFDGILAIVIAILIASRWPQGSLEFIGILVGFCFISGGVWRIVLGRALRAANL